MINQTIFKELVKRGHSLKNGTRVWDIADSKLWYLTPELSKGFLNLKRYQPYRKAVVEREIELLKKEANNIVGGFKHKSFNLVDLGCGSGKKAETFVGTLNRDVRLRYCPVDISPYFIERASETISNIRSGKVSSIRNFVSDFENLADILGVLRSSQFQHNLVLLLGETLSHYDVNDFLYNLSKDMFKGDCLVIGNGIRVGERFVALEKYKDPLFNDWFIHVVKGLGFDENEVEYNARFANRRLEGYYIVKTDKTVEYDGKKVTFKKGDEIVVAIQHKFFEKELKKFCGMYFKSVEIKKSDDGEYCLIVCKK